MLERIELEKVFGALGPCPAPRKSNQHVQNILGKPMDILQVCPKANPPKKEVHSHMAYICLRV